MKKMQELKDGDFITIDLFGKKEKVEIFSTGDNERDEDGNYRENGFALDDKEIACLSWFIENVNIADYKKEITEYCNERYGMIDDKQITETDIENEVCISAIAINISIVTQAMDGFVYPEIGFYGDCECDSEHGICVGFRDKKFLGVSSQDWIL